MPTCETRSPELALQRLRASENEPLRWLLGPTLERRAAQELWQCVPLLFLNEGNEILRRYWNGIIAKFRAVLQNPEEAPRKVQDELNPTACDFEQQLHDLNGEIIALLHLQEHGYQQFRIQLRKRGESTPDFYAVSPIHETLIPVEFKNLRLTRSADAALLEAFVERSGTIRGEGMNIALVNNSPYFVEHLEAEALRNWALNLKLEIGLHTLTLPDGQSVTIRVCDGSGDLRIEQYVNDPDTRVWEGLYNKAKRVIDEQVLRKPIMRGAGHKIAILRWCIPADILLWNYVLKAQLQQALRTEHRNVNPELEIHIFTDWDHQEDKFLQ